MPAGIELADLYVRLSPTIGGGSNPFAGIENDAANAGTRAGSSFGSNMKKTVAGVGGIAGVAAVVVTGLYKIGETFDEVSDTLRTNTGATGAELAGLEDIVKNVGATVPAEFTAIGETVSSLEQKLGIGGDALTDLSSQYLEAERLLGEPIDIDTTTGAFNAFGLTGDALTESMDYLFQASQATGTSMNDLASIAESAAPQMQALGYSFEETVAMAGMLDKAGFDAQAMMKGMGKALVSLAKDGEEPQAAFKRVTSEIDELIKQGKTGEATKLAADLFGSKGANQFVASIQNGTLNLAEFQSQMSETGDTIMGVGAETMDFAESWQLVQNNAMLALEPLASTVFSAISEVLATILPYLQDFSSWLADNQWLLGVVAAFIGVTLVGAFIAWQVQIWGVNAALLSNPITWVVLAIVALIAGIVYLATQTSFFQDTWEAMGNAVDGVINSITDGWGAFATWMDETFGWIGDLLTGIWSDSEQSAIDSVTTQVEILNWLLDMIGEAYKRLNTFTGGALATSIDILGNGAVTFDDITNFQIEMPGLANGGELTRGGLTRVGERGEEILQLPTGSKVIPLDHPAASELGSGSVTNNYLTVNNPRAERASKTPQLRNQLEGALI